MIDPNYFQAHDLAKNIRVIDATFPLDKAKQNVSHQTMANCFEKAFKNVPNSKWCKRFRKFVVTW